MGATNGSSGHKCALVQLAAQEKGRGVSTPEPPHMTNHARTVAHDGRPRPLHRVQGTDHAPTRRHMLKHVKRRAGTPGKGTCGQRHAKKVSGRSCFHRTGPLGGEVRAGGVRSADLLGGG
jgi:hypothetical protein